MRFRPSVFQSFDLSRPALLAGLRSYFYSGWAFLIPYLAVYLLYYVTKWPVNPAAGAAVGQGSEVIGHGPIPHLLSPMPPLLHVYWFLHTIHVIGAGFALWSWWRAHTHAAISEKSSEISIPDQKLKPYHLNLITRIAPWCLLALLFYIPGVYLEWPSDPWEHLRRINEWRILDTVGAHSSWMKSAYFIPYSMLSWCIGLRQLFWLDFYYTGICLLLCWQYYRFSRACGLGERASMVFVIIQALLFGNNIFSFYRYYGISSSIYAQLGAIALTRIVLEFAARGTKLAKTERLVEDEKTIRLAEDGESVRHAESSASRPSSASSDSTLSPITHSLSPHPATPSALGVRFWTFQRLALLLSSALTLSLFTAFNHVQGIGIAGLGIVAVIVWRLIEWKRSALLWLIGGTIVVNALFLWLYPRPPIIETYRTQGYLNAWYGFNILDISAPAGDRMLQIISVFGLVNIAAAALLLRRNHILAWSTLIPLLITLLPFYAVPFGALACQAAGELNIVTFQRMLFACPSCLAVILLLSKVRYSSHLSTHHLVKVVARYSSLAVAVIVFALLIVPPPTNLSSNRFWHFCHKTPDDLRMTALWDAIMHAPPTPRNTATVASSPINALLLIRNKYTHICSYSRTGSDPTADLLVAVHFISSVSQPIHLFIPAPMMATSSNSISAITSRHWRAQEVVLAYSGVPELKHMAESYSLRLITVSIEDPMVLFAR